MLLIGTQPLVKPDSTTGTRLKISNSIPEILRRSTAPEIDYADRYGAHEEFPPTWVFVVLVSKSLTLSYSALHICKRSRSTVI